MNKTEVAKQRLTALPAGFMNIVGGSNSNLVSAIMNCVTYYFKRCMLIAETFQATAAKQKGEGMLDCIALGKKIQEYRIKNNYHQDQLGELLYVSRQAVSRWELGQAVPTIDNLITLTRLFGVSFEELLCLNEEPDPQNLFRGYNREYIIRRICDGELKVDLPEDSSSDAPMRVKMRSTMPNRADFAGTKEPICAISTMRAT